MFHFLLPLQTEVKNVTEDLWKNKRFNDVIRSLAKAEFHHKL